AILLGLTLVGIAALPVLDLNCTLLPLYVLLAWSLPGILLGVTLPWMKPRACLPPFCAVMASILGVVFLVLGIFHQNWILMLIPALILALTAIQIAKKREVQEYWPLAALALAIIACATTPLLLDEASFRGVLGK